MKNITKLINTAFMLAALLTAATAISAPDSAAQFESQLAMSHLIKAQKPQQFEESAAALKHIIDRGIRNAPLFYNYGTAMLMANHPQEALNAFIRAERYSGTTWEIKRNMLLATEKLDEDSITPRLPWYRIPLFWHYGLAGRTRLTIASTAFLLLWLTPLIISNRKKDARRIIFGSALVILILFGSSAATTIYQEHHINQMVLSDE
jgi:hypothetical protein